MQATHQQEQATDDEVRLDLLPGGGAALVPDQYGPVGQGGGDAVCDHHQLVLPGGGVHQLHGGEGVRPVALCRGSASSGKHMQVQ